MVKLKKLQTDVDAQNNGVWLSYPQGGEFLIARVENENMQKKRRQLESNRRNRTLTDEEALKDGRAIVAESVLLDWRGIEDSAGNPWEYSLENSLFIMTDPSTKDLALWILSEAGQASNYASQQIEEDAKN